MSIILIEPVPYGIKPEDHGGNLTIENPKFFIMNNSLLATNAYVGNGGNISIIADQFIKSSDSLINASSELGVDGEININSPDENLNEFVPLPLIKFNEPKLSSNRCLLYKENLSQFLVTGRKSLSQAFDDLKI